MQLPGAGPRWMWLKVRLAQTPGCPTRAKDLIPSDGAFWQHLSKLSTKRQVEETVCKVRWVNRRGPSPRVNACNGRWTNPLDRPRSASALGRRGGDRIWAPIAPWEQQLVNEGQAWGSSRLS